MCRPDEQGGWSVFGGVREISGDVHLHVMMAGGRTGTGAVTPSLSLRQVLKTALEVGLVIVPDVSGKPRAFILAATPAVREWVEQGFESESLPWQAGDTSAAAPTP
jgi:hypothetical protein